MILDLPRLIRMEEPYWKELENLLNALESDASRRLSVTEAYRLHYLYRRASSNLVRLSTFASAPEMSSYVETLVSRAYSEIYGSTGPTRWIRFGQWFTQDLPQAFRRHLHAFAMSCLLTLAGVLFGAGALALDSDAKEVLVVHDHLQQTPTQRVEKEKREQGENLEGKKASFSGFLMTHNMRVSLFTLALGITYGVGTTIMLFYNGVILGSICLDYIRDGQTAFLVGWLLPHGSVEIPAILLAGQGGFILAQALIGHRNRLGLRQRFQSIRHDLLTLIGGIGLLLIWAGIIEAFFSQYHEPVIPYSLKITFGSVQLLLLFLYLFRVGKEKAEN
jgi:uncharacterized membrane protein SpoIIM required for sporulation